MIFNSKQITNLDITKIMSYLPHRYPFLLVDKITTLTPNSNIVGVKNVTINEPFFQGHFPSKPIMPGVLIIEAMAQISGVLAFESLAENAHNRLCYFLSIDNARFRIPVVPGDVLELRSEIIQSRSMICKFSCEAFVEGKKVSEAVIRAKIDF